MNSPEFYQPTSSFQPNHHTLQTPTHTLQTPTFTQPLTLQISPLSSPSFHTPNPPNPRDADPDSSKIKHNHTL